MAGLPAGRVRSDELRELAAGGDDEASRQLASWLSDRAYPRGVADPAKFEETIDVIRPVADAGDDVADLWLARWLADCDRIEELRERAGAGSDHASRELARLLADHDLLNELRTRASASDEHHALGEPARRLIERDLDGELRELLEAADADKRQLILDAVDGASSAWPNAVRVLAGFGHRASQHHLVLRQRPAIRLPAMSLLWALALPAARPFRAPSRPDLSAASGAVFARRPSLHTSRTK